MISIRMAISRAQLARLDALSTTLYRSAGIIDQRTGPLNDAGEYMHEQFGQRFTNEAGGTGRWKKLAPSTVKSRRKLGYGPEHPILQRKQGLLKAATGNFNANRYWKGTSYRRTPVRSVWEMTKIGGLVGGVRSRNNISQHQLTIGVESEGGYATVLNRKRPFIYATVRNEEHIRGIFQKWVNAVIRRARA